MILVTGGGGYVGSLLVPELLALGESVRVVDLFWFDHRLDPHPHLETIAGDIRRPDAAWLDGVTGIIHLAGLSNDPTADFAPALNAESNVQATRELAGLVAQRTAVTNQDCRFVFASSCSVYYTEASEVDGDVRPKREDSLASPTANYSKTKRLAELELLKLAARFPHFCPVILRKGTLFGHAPRMRFDLVVNTFTLHAWSKRQLTVHGSGESWRPLLHVRDAVDAYLYSLAAPLDRVRAQTFNVLKKNYRTLELAHWVSEILEQHRHVQISVKRDRSVQSGARSYYVLGDKMTRELGFLAERGTTRAVLDIWDNLERGAYGDKPQENARYFNIRWFKERCLPEDASSPIAVGR